MITRNHKRRKFIRMFAMAMAAVMTMGVAVLIWSLQSSTRATAGH